MTEYNKVMTTSRRDFLRLTGGGLLLVVTSGALPGCGGGGSNNGNTVGGGSTTGTFSRVATPLSLPIDWSKGNAKSVVVTLMGAQPGAISGKSIALVHPSAQSGVNNFVWTINRSSDTSNTYHSPQSVLSGTSLVSLDFYDAADGGGNKAYHIVFVADVDVAGAGLPQIKPGASPDSYSAPRSLTVGTKADVPPLVTGHSGNALTALAPGTLTYTLLDGSDVVQLNADGSLRGLKTGSATVSAKSGGNEVAQTKVTASITFNVSSYLIFDNSPVAVAPGQPTYYDVNQQATVSATYVLSSPNSPKNLTYIWEGLDNSQIPNADVLALVDDRNSFKFSIDPSSTALHPKAMLTILRPSPHRLANYWLRLADKSLYCIDDVIIRVPTLGKYGKENLKVTTDQAGTGLNYIDITQRESALPGGNPGTGLNGTGVMYYTESGVAKQAEVTWYTGWNDGVAYSINSSIPPLGWGDVFFGRLSGPPLYFQGKYANPDTTDFSKVQGKVIIGNYAAEVTLVKNGGDVSGPSGGQTGANPYAGTYNGTFSGTANGIESDGVSHGSFTFQIGQDGGVVTGSASLTFATPKSSATITEPSIIATDDRGNLLFQMEDSSNPRAILFSLPDPETGAFAIELSGNPLHGDGIYALQTNSSADSGTYRGTATVTKTST